MGKKIHNLWSKLLIVVLIICGFLIVVGYLYYENSSCAGNVWNCLEFEVMILGGGILVFSLPIIIILFIWEVYSKIKKKKNSKKNFFIGEKDDFSELDSRFEELKAENKEPQDELSKKILKYAKEEKEE